MINRGWKLTTQSINISQQEVGGWIQNVARLVRAPAHDAHSHNYGITTLQERTRNHDDTLAHSSQKRHKLLSKNDQRWKPEQAVPGKLVPKATNVIAVTLSLRPTVQPKEEATSPTTPVRRPMTKMEIQKQSQPPR